jgi:hypothetical protein
VAERESINLPTHPGETLLQRLWEEAIDPVKGLGVEDASQLYKMFLRQQSSVSKTQKSQVQLSHQNRREVIQKTIAILVRSHYEGLEEKRLNEKIGDLVDKVEREISRIEFQAGVKQANVFLERKFSERKQEPAHKAIEYLTASFVERLTTSVVENEILTDEFPIYLNYFEIENVKPLPLYVKRDGQDMGLLNPFLLSDSEDQDSINGLERQFAHRIKVHFYIRLPNDYESPFPDITSVKQVGGAKRLDFMEEITGIGSPLSHVIAVINRILFWDIPILQDYLPIPNEMMAHDDAIGRDNHGPMWSHSLVRLYRYQDVERAIADDQPCERVAESCEVAYGEYCGFDLVEVALKSALHARLRLIKQTGVDPKLYLQQLCDRMEELNALKRAKNYLEFYPFSLRAMEGELERTVFRNKYRTRQKGFRFVEQQPGERWSVAAYEAQLEIAEANLKEGLYRIAKRYLDAIKPFFTEGTNPFVGHSLFAKYHLCRFRCDYLIDLEDREDHAYPDRYQAVRSAESCLEEAQKCLDRRLEKYYKVNELPQTNFHPHFHLLCKIYAHRAKLYLFFPAYTRRPGKWDALIEPVRLLEKARICAARDGDPTLYAQWSAYQSWCYLMVAYLADQSQLPNKEFSYGNCIDWAKRLLDHALLCYVTTGRTCYQQIKDNGGKATDHLPSQGTKRSPSEGEEIYYESYGNTWIQVVPLIQELNGEKVRPGQRYKYPQHVLRLDMSILKQIHQNPEDSIYLFGNQSSIILFGMGMLELCSLKDAEPLQEAIQRKALRMFNYCWAIASDGTQRHSDPEEERLTLDRAFSGDDIFNQADDLLIRGLYPHRLTQFTDLGKIFVAVCKLLLLISSPEMEQYYAEGRGWETTTDEMKAETQSIIDLMDDLCRNNRFPFPESEALGQKRYNGHLAEHYKNISQYFKDLIQIVQTKRLRSRDLIQNRDRIVTHVFEMIRGTGNVLP